MKGPRIQERENKNKKAKEKNHPTEHHSQMHFRYQLQIHQCMIKGRRTGDIVEHVLHVLLVRSAEHEMRTIKLIKRFCLQNKAAQTNRQKNSPCSAIWSG